MLAEMQIDLVLTAHPTESMRRTLIQKYEKIEECLSEFDGGTLSRRRDAQIKRRLKRLISECWHPNEMRATRPSPIDEAKWGFAMIENSLWIAVPDFLRELSTQMEPLHVVQAELLRRDRESPQQPLVERALIASIAGIAAGMRNTG